MSTALNTPIVEGGLDRIPFFNGRVLTAEDLKTEQNANADERRRLGRALGTGVVDGLFVRKTSDQTVTVESGLGLAPSGQVVELPQTTEVSVLSSIEREETAGTRGAFADCAVQSATVTTGAGAYLLVVEPASTPDGRTPRTTLGGDGAAGDCGAKRRVEGARLRLVPLDTGNDALVPSSLADGEGEYDVQNLSQKIVEARENDEEPMPKRVSKLRNVLAHVCLRTPSALADTASLYDTLRRQARGERSDPVGSEGPLDVLRRRARQGRVDDLDDAVPLGLLYWSSDRIEFVDVWSVRRRVHPPDPRRPVPATARRRAETEAAVFQFQAHLGDLVRALSRSQRDWVRAPDYFAFLPPVGTVPIERTDQNGLRPSVFFEGLTARDPLFVEGGTLRSLLYEASRYDALRMHPDRLLWQYHVREDVQARGGSPSFVMFSNGFVPEAADPQYNRSRWDYANYGPVVAGR
jgi:hypothetical protein